MEDTCLGSVDKPALLSSKDNTDDLDPENSRACQVVLKENAISAPSENRLHSPIDQDKVPKTMDSR